jgi:hypothetical protein
MAASAAKFAHCQPRYPVEYRAKSPFRPWLVPPLDFTVRASALYSLDHELDRAVLRPSDLSEVLEEELWRHPGPGGIFRVEPEPVRSHPPRVPLSAGPFRRQFLLNVVRLARDSTRYRPPWTVSMVLEAHGTLLRGLGVGPEPPGFRTSPHLAQDPDGFTMQMHCPPVRIRGDLQAVLEWVDRFGPGYHPVIPATVLLQALHSIRPFPAGNMTTARALTVLYLHFHGLPNAELAHIADAAVVEPNLLLRLLRWTESTGSYTELLDHILESSLVAYEASARRWLRPAGSSGSLEELAVRLLARARRTPGWFSAREAQSWVGNRGGPTVRKHLNLLVAQGFLESAGQTRGKRFRRISRESYFPGIESRYSRRPPTGPRAGRSQPMRGATEPPGAPGVPDVAGSD